MTATMNVFQEKSSNNSLKNKTKTVFTQKIETSVAERSDFY